MSKAAVAVALLVLSFLAALPAGEAPGTVARYVAATTAVAKSEGQPALADAGALLCVSNLPGNPTPGGACITFGPYDSVLVSDLVWGADVAFQVCIDNNGDGLCGGDAALPCADDLYLSHDDDEVFFNPLGPLRMGFAPGCPGGTFAGYLVFLCDGAHQAGPRGTHLHWTSSGAVVGVTGGTGYGDYCASDGGLVKAYRVV